MRPIDADKIKFNGLNNRVCPDLSAQDVIDEQPTIDAVSVVRCRNCMYFRDSKINKKGFLICPASGMEITENDFCSYGEKKDDSNEPN